MSELTKKATSEEGCEGLKLRMGDEDNFWSNEFTDEYNHYLDIIEDIAHRYVDFNKYELWTEDDAETYNEGTPLEYDVLYIKIYLVDKATGKRQWIGGVDYADNRWDCVTYEEKKKDYVVLYDDDYVRKGAEEVFENWKKDEAEEDETNE